jgi:hypothetical protein
MTATTTHKRQGERVGGVDGGVLSGAGVPAPLRGINREVDCMIRLRPFARKVSDGPGKTACVI